MQEGFDKGKQFTIENSLYVSGLMAGSSVLGKGVGFKDVAPDLAAEGDVSFFTVHFLQLLFSLALLEENHTRFENLHGCGPVRMLGTLILALDDNPAGYVGNAYG